MVNITKAFSLSNLESFMVQLVRTTHLEMLPCRIDFEDKSTAWESGCLCSNPCFATSQSDDLNKLLAFLCLIFSSVK